MIYQGSRYTKTNLYDRKGTLTFKHRNRFSLGMKDSIIHTFDISDTLDGLSARYYNNPQLWWVILDANPQFRCEVDIPIGYELVIPDFEEVRKCLNL